MVLGGAVKMSSVNSIILRVEEVVGWSSSVGRVGLD